MIEIKHVIISSYSYGAPEVSSYGAPEPAYAEPVVEEYSAPAYTAEGEVLDIGSLVLPILVIVGELSVIKAISLINILISAYILVLTFNTIQPPQQQGDQPRHSNTEREEAPKTDSLG